MKLSITVASIIALVAAAPVEVRDPQRFGSGAPSGGIQNGAQLPQDYYDDGGSTGSGAPPGGIQNGANLGGPATGPKKDNRFTPEVCDNLVQGYDRDFAKKFGVRLLAVSMSLPIRSS